MKQYKYTSYTIKQVAQQLDVPLQRWCRLRCHIRTDKQLQFRVGNNVYVVENIGGFIPRHNNMGDLLGFRILELVE